MFQQYIAAAKTYLMMYKTTGERHYRVKAIEQIALARFESISDDLAKCLEG